MYATCLYHSTSLSERDLDHSLCVKARLRNRQLGISGTLHRQGDTFTQLLEGPEAAIDCMMQRILRDPRHADLQIVFSSTLEHRRFDQWAMGYTSDETADFDRWALRHRKIRDIRIADPETVLAFLSQSHLLDTAVPRRRPQVRLPRAFLRPGRRTGARTGLSG